MTRIDKARATAIDLAPILGVEAAANMAALLESFLAKQSDAAFALCQGESPEDLADSLLGAFRNYCDNASA